MNQWDCVKLGGFVVVVPLLIAAFTNIHVACAFPNGDDFRYNDSYVGTLNGVVGNGCDNRSVANAFEKFNMTMPANYTCRYWMPTCDFKILDVMPA